MSSITQIPSPGSQVLSCAGDFIDFSIDLGAARRGHAILRTNIGHAATARRETIALNDSGLPILARDWHDLPMEPSSPTRFSIRLPLLEVGVFEAKACFIPDGSSEPEWPEGGNVSVKVRPARTACANTIYTAFVRQFGPSITRDARTAPRRHAEATLASAGYAVLPPSGTFRDLIRRLDHIHGRLGFRILQLLPIHPTPTTYARMGLFGSAFAALDFMSVDPALAEFDRHATPLDQFRELVDAVHAHGASIFMDMPANHTGWASTLQTHHPEWFRRTSDNAFESPGAWGVTWEDLVALDYSHNELRGAMAEVFLYWCRQGVDGFRCDAGYMIPAETWRYILARVRSEYPETTFLLEGLGGKIETTETLLRDGLDWAYSEIFQTNDRSAFERYLPGAMDLSRRAGPLVHFAETHDNTRLAAVSRANSHMRVALAALCSQQGAFGITAGVEWFATERVDVHGASPLAWDARENQVAWIAKLNRLLATHPAFAPGVIPRMVQFGAGNVLAIAREAGNASLLALVNLDHSAAQEVRWPACGWMGSAQWNDLLADNRAVAPRREGDALALRLEPGEALCLAPSPAQFRLDTRHEFREPPALVARRARLMALRALASLAGEDRPIRDLDDAATSRFLADPYAFCAEALSTRALPPVAEWRYPQDLRRVVPLPRGQLLLVRSPVPFRLRVFLPETMTPSLKAKVATFLPTGNTGKDRTSAFAASPGRCISGGDSVPSRDGFFCLVAIPVRARREAIPLEVEIHAFGEGAATGAKNGAPRNCRATSTILALPPLDAIRIATRFDGAEIRTGHHLALLTNGRGAMSHASAAWGEIQSQYDALLATNPDPEVPCDRRVFWTACRAWLVNRGYSQSIDASCAASFEAMPGGNRACWRFDVPCGAGRLVPVEFTLELAEGRNRATLTARRLPSEGHPEALDDATPVTLIFRPDIEARSFHEKTKAYAGPESAWPGAVAARRDGFDFNPGPGESYAFRSRNAAFHQGHEWRYQVPHPIDASRGLGPSSDLFSPGWFEMRLLGGESGALSAGIRMGMDADRTPAAPVPAAREPHGKALPLAEALSGALDAYLVRRNEHRTVIAGYPWFLDWGRDTLIVLRGIIADGRLDTARDILREFGRYEENGTLPNIIRGRDVGNRDTSDAPLWFAVAVGDMLRAQGGGDALDLDCGGRPLRDVLVSIATHYRDGTPNGIRMDPGSGLVYSPSHFTWMDTNYPAGTPRAGYPVEIQALWIATLDLLADRVDPAWGALARKARASLKALFALPEGWLADCLRANPGTPAAQAVKEDALRPNQLFAVTLGAFSPRDPLCKSIIRACARLVIPGAIRTLDDAPVRTPLPVWRDGALLNDPSNPYWGEYAGDEDTRRKPAYHNGTAWTWVFPAFCEAMGRHSVHGATAAHDLLGSIAGVLSKGCLGQPPEILDGNAPHKPRGCDAQAWGVSEALRVLKTR